MADIYNLFDLSPERLAQLRGEGEAPVKINWANYDLPEPSHKETVLGKLTDEEGEVFAMFYRSREDLETLQRNAIGDCLTRLGQTFKASDVREQNLGEKLIEQGQLQFADEAAERSYYRTKMLAEHLKAMLYYSLSERFDAHEWVLGVRSNGRVVKIEKRLERGEL